MGARPIFSRLRPRSHKWPSRPTPLRKCCRIHHVVCYDGSPHDIPASKTAAAAAADATDDDDVTR